MIGTGHHGHYFVASIAAYGPACKRPVGVFVMRDRPLAGASGLVCLGHARAACVHLKPSSMLRGGLIGQVVCADFS
jgi:hypothetical protein